jgi:hypothetical protein
MKKLFTILFMLSFEYVFSQNFVDSLNFFYTKAVNEKDVSIIEKYSSKIVDLTEQLIEKKSINQSFVDSLKGINLLVSENKKVVVLTYEIVNQNNNLLYKGVVFNKVNKTWYKNILEDTGTKEKKLESFVGKPQSWIGCRYYKIVSLKEKGKQIYILFASNLSDKTISRKWIDVLVIDEKYDIYFGESIFDGMPIKRFVLQYNSKVVASLKYDKSKKLIIFDHLIAPRSELKNQFQFYSPDLSFDAFEIKNNKLKFLKDIDARNPGN